MLTDDRAISILLEPNEPFGSGELKSEPMLTSSTPCIELTGILHLLL